jgi:vacuolar-type H+-ATPase subunit H
MPWVQLIILLVFIFIGLLFFLKHILNQSFTSATEHLQKLSKDHASKQAEIDKRLKEAKEEAQGIVSKAKKDAEDSRSKMLQEAYEEKDRIVKEAHIASEEMVEKAEKTCDFLKQELNQKIEYGALEKASELIQSSLPEKIRQEMHSLWMKDSSKADFQIKSINLPDGLNEVKVVSAFSLTQHERQELVDKLKKKINRDINLKEEVDPKLVAGFVIAIGSVVIDASLRYKIQSYIKSAK